MRITVTASKHVNKSINSATYIDVGGGFGEVGEKYTDKDLREMWEMDHDGDPSMAEYGDDFDSWYLDTINNYMKRVDDVEGCGSVTAATISTEDMSDVYMFMRYEAGSPEDGMEGDDIYPLCQFRAVDIDDARDQVRQYCEDAGLPTSEYYADYYNPNFEDPEEPIFDSLEDYLNYEGELGESEEIDKDLEDITALEGSTDIECYTDPDSTWEMLERKSVPDSDGFYTDYTLYRNTITGEYGCMFGDTDLYTPETGYFDWEGDSEEEAYEWFESYNGFEDADDDIYSTTEITGSLFDFGAEEAAKYGDLICENLSGKTVSKSKAKAEEPGGLICEANALGIDMWDLLRALEGLCRQGRAEEIDDSTYLVKGGEPHEVRTLFGADEAVKCAVELTPEEEDRLWEIVDVYNGQSNPASGDWDTETEHEQQAIADEFGVSLDEAKDIMINYLGFEDSMFA